MSVCRKHKRQGRVSCACRVTTRPLTDGYGGPDVTDVALTVLESASYSSYDSTPSYDSGSSSSYDSGTSSSSSSYDSGSSGGGGSDYSY